MFALFLVLNDTDYLDEILARFVDVGVQGHYLGQPGYGKCAGEQRDGTTPLGSLMPARRSACTIKPSSPF